MAHNIESEKLEKLLVMQAQQSEQLRAIRESIDIGQRNLDRRFDEFKESVAQRLDTHEKRLDAADARMEKLTWKVASGSAVIGAAAAVAIEFFKIKLS